MPNRPNLSLDQQFFQELLSAAYTIQQHNDRLNDERLNNDDRLNDDHKINDSGPDSRRDRLTGDRSSGDRLTGERVNGDRLNLDNRKNDQPAHNRSAQAILKKISSSSSISSSSNACLHCGAEKPAGQTHCEQCDPENFRPG